MSETGGHFGDLPAGNGDQGTPDGSIRPNEALVFVIDAVSVTPAAR